MLYLVARTLGFDAIVSRDLAQFDQHEESVALAMASISMVTWTKAIEDPVAEWGQLLAYGTQVAKVMARAEFQPTIFYLPAPRLAAGKQEAASLVPRRLAGDNKTSYPEWRDGAVKTMRQYLSASKSPRADAVTKLLDAAATS